MGGGADFGLIVTATFVSKGSALIFFSKALRKVMDMVQMSWRGNLARCPGKAVVVGGNWKFVGKIWLAQMSKLRRWKLVVYRYPGVRGGT